MFFSKKKSKKKESKPVSCEEARDAVLLTGGLRMVCPDDVDNESHNIVVKEINDQKEEN